jgi:hypothetical protein
MGAALGVSQPPERNGRHSGTVQATPITPSAQTTKEQLEGLVLEMLERMQTQFQ